MYIFDMGIGICRNIPVNRTIEILNCSLWIDLNHILFPKYKFNSAN